MIAVDTEENVFIAESSNEYDGAKCWVVDDDDSHRTRYSELQQAFDFYNQRLFDGELPECLITFQRVTLELFQGKFALSWFDRFPVQVEQQKEMAAVIDQWRETTCSSTSKC
ncbi:hypothetical protein [Escherichia coli]|uniref:hypothetical protein n=1 Tax=Escherichia coli TaxID=562 RepID=UPI00201AE7E8|nr:hypothetical protein [Escherichia coli]